MYELGSTRRDFLKTAGGLIVTFTLADSILAAVAQGTAPTKTVALDDVDAFLAIGADGRVTLYTGKVDLGTGIRTALTQIAAEELDLPFDRVTVTQGDTALTPDQGPTWGSFTIQNGGMQIRRAAATARKGLLELAANRLGVAADALSIDNGTIKGNGRSVSYAELVGGRTFSLRLRQRRAGERPGGLRHCRQVCPTN